MTTTFFAPSARTARTAAAMSAAARRWFCLPSEKPCPRRSKGKANTPWRPSLRANGTHWQRSPTDMCAMTTAVRAPGFAPPKR